LVVICIIEEEDDGCRMEEWGTDDIGRISIELPLSEDCCCGCRPSDNQCFGTLCRDLFLTVCHFFNKDTAEVIFLVLNSE
jgi:hypothetical protein